MEPGSSPQSPEQKPASAAHVAQPPAASPPLEETQAFVPGVSAEAAAGSDKEPASANAATPSASPPEASRSPVETRQVTYIPVRRAASAAAAPPNLAETADLGEAARRAPVTAAPHPPATPAAETRMPRPPAAEPTHSPPPSAGAITQPPAPTPEGAPSVPAPAAARTAAPGQPEQGRTPMLGEYRLLKKLGSGGMGTVYLAKQERLDRLVALKVLSRELAGNPTFVQRFLREARVMARLDHPNILHCYDVGQTGGWHYLAMEYAEGGSVESWLQKLGRFSLADALHITLACARALQHAHEQNLVHRDVKPENLLLTAKGVVKLADLGLAKAQDDDLSLTRTGTGAGTPLYMAPEQARDVKHVDARCDIYALGCMLYRFLAGVLPFSGNTLVEVIEAKMRGKFTPLRQRNPEVPPRLDLIVDKMLAANPAHRYQSCAEVIRELEQLGLAGERLSFFPAGGAAPPARGPATVSPAAARPTQTPLAKATQTPARPAAPSPAAETDEDIPSRQTAPPPAAEQAESEPGVWYLHLEFANGRSVNKKISQADLAALIKSGGLTADTPVARSAQGPYRPLAAYAEWEDLLQARAVQQEAERKGQRYRRIYQEILEQETQRRRWRWLDKILGRFSDLFRFLLGLGILLAGCVGAYFVIRWLLQLTGFPLLSGSP